MLSSRVRLAIVLVITAVLGAVVSQVAMPWWGIVALGAVCGVLWGIGSYADARKLEGDLRRATVWLVFLAGVAALAGYVVIARRPTLDQPERLMLFAAAVLGASALAEVALIIRVRREKPGA